MMPHQSQALCQIPIDDWGVRKPKECVRTLKLAFCMEKWIFEFTLRWELDFLKEK